MWHRRGEQAKIPTPGKNRKHYVFGAIDYRTGRFFYHVQETHNQLGCLVIVQKLLAWARSTHIRVLLVWDNAKTHSAKRLAAYLEQPEVRRWIKVFWLSTYSPDLNDIERLWRHVKRTGMSNYLFRNATDFRDHLLKVLASVNRRSNSITAITFTLAKVA